MINRNFQSALITRRDMRRHALKLLQTHTAIPVSLSKHRPPAHTHQTVLTAAATANPSATQAPDAVTAPPAPVKTAVAGSVV
jgi:hypothetical protein